MAFFRQNTGAGCLALFQGIFPNQGNEEYIIIIAKTPNQLVKEGSTLHHCVGRMNYDSKMALGYNVSSTVEELLR